MPYYGNIAYTLHAEHRMRSRHITKDWVDSAVRNPDKISEVREGKMKATKKINDDKISVIYVDKHNILVVTVYWGE